MTNDDRIMCWQEQKAGRIRDSIHVRTCSVIDSVKSFSGRANVMIFVAP